MILHASNSNRRWQVSDPELGFQQEHIAQTVDQVLGAAPVQTLPEDCVFGDGGAYSLISEGAAGSSTDKVMGKPKPAPKRPRDTNTAPRSSIDDQESFATMLSSTDRSFSIGETGCVVKISSSVTTASTCTVATVHDKDDKKCGYISTAAPLGTTLGLKATCTIHKERGLPACQCWIQIPKSKGSELTPGARLDLFRTLCTWIGEGNSKSRECHFNDSFTIRVAAGMKPRSQAHSG